MKNRIKELREKHFYTLDDLARLTGIKRGTINNYENEKTEPKLKVWKKLADFFGVSVAYLQGLPEESEAQKKCPYCHGDEIFLLNAKSVIADEYENGISTADVSIKDNKLILDLTVDQNSQHDNDHSKFEIKFCPMCGRRLQK